VQDDSSGKINIFGHNSIGHCKKTKRTINVSNTERLLGQSSLNSQIKSTVNDNKEREITYC